jgi:hypothetical protein
MRRCIVDTDEFSRIATNAYGIYCQAHSRGDSKYIAHGGELPVSHTDAGPDIAHQA